MGGEDQRSEGSNRVVVGRAAPASEACMGDELSMRSAPKTWASGEDFS